MDYYAYLLNLDVTPYTQAQPHESEGYGFLGVRYSTLLRILSLVHYERLTFPELSKDLKEQVFHRNIANYEMLFNIRSLKKETLNDII
jgi:hypothetical protein